MPEGNAENEALPIRCPGCGQRFRVGQELMGRMVECGTCEHRFRVSEDVVVRQKKHYPGERRDRGLEKFSRVPLTPSAPVNFQPAVQLGDGGPRLIEPMSPRRMICGVAALMLGGFTAFLLMTAGKPGGLLDGANVSKRLILAGFAGAILVILTILANARTARMKAFFGGVLGAAALMSLPFLFREGTESRYHLSVSSSGDDEVGALLRKPEGEEGSLEVSELDEIKKKVLYDPLAKELQRYATDPSKDNLTAFGVWLTGMRESRRLQVQDYIVRAMDADLTSHMYPRSPNYLMVVSGVPDNMQRLIDVCSRFGTVTRKIEELRLIEVEVGTDVFVEGELDKLSDKEHPSFYALNLRELESIDLQRAKRAADRLTGVEPKQYRTDITKRMSELLGEAEKDLQISLIQALDVWAESEDGSVEAVRRVLKEWIDKKYEIHESAVRFLVHRKDMEILPWMHEIWLSNPTNWEVLYGELGSAIEPNLLKTFEMASVKQKMSIIRLLTKVGTPACLPALESAFEKEQGEVKGMIEKAIEEVKKRQP